MIYLEANMFHAPHEESSETRSERMYQYDACEAGNVGCRGTSYIDAYDKIRGTKEFVSGFPFNKSNG